MPHTHDHTGIEINRRFQLAIAMNVVIVVLEVVYGLLSHSIALIADAGHNLADVLALIFAMGASFLSARPPTARRTYGFRRTTILAALLNAMIMLVMTGAILYGAIDRFRSPVSVDGGTVSLVAGIAILLNAISAFLLHQHSKHDLNVCAPFLHLVGDAASAAGVLIAGIIISYSGMSWVDPLASIIIAMVILFATWRVLRESFNLAADAVPEKIDPSAIESYLKSVDGVRDIHDLHIWGMSTTHVVLTAHLVIPERTVEDSMLFDISRELHDRYGIEHSTLQVERGSIECELESSHVI